MASVGHVTLLDNESLSGAGPHVGPAKSLEQWQTNLIFVATVTNGAGNTATVTIQESPDGVNWHTLGAIPVVTGNDQEILKVTASVLPQMRTSIALGGAASGDVTVKVHYDKK